MGRRPNDYRLLINDYWLPIVTIHFSLSTNDDFWRVSADTKTFGSGLYPALTGDLCLLSGKQVGTLTELRTKIREKMNKFSGEGVERNKVSGDQINRKWILGESRLMITGNQNIRTYYLEKAHKQEDNRLKTQDARHKGI